MPANKRKYARKDALADAKRGFALDGNGVVILPGGKAKRVSPRGGGASTVFVTGKLTLPLNPAAPRSGVSKIVRASKQLLAGEPGRDKSFRVLIKHKNIHKRVLLPTPVVFDQAEFLRVMGADKPARKRIYRDLVTDRRNRVTLSQVAIEDAALLGETELLSDSQRAAIEAARKRAWARLQRPDMSAEALLERERLGAEWEATHGPIRAFAGTRRHRQVGK